jgi:predicted HTH transcriptional regulator
MESIDIFSRYLEEKMEQQDRALVNLRSYGLSTRQEDVLAEMIQSGEPTTAYELATMFNTQVQNIRKDLLVLMDKGLVDIYGKDGRKITYIYKGKS